MNTCKRFALLAAAILVMSGVAEAQENLLKGCDFSKDAKGWNGLGSDDKKEVALVHGDKNGLVLTCKAAGDGAAAQLPARIDQTVRLRPQTLYKLSITGFGNVPTTIRLRPTSSKDDKFGTVLKPWAVTTAPLVVTNEPRTTEFVFDSGLKADSTAVMVYLTEPAKIGSYTISSISLTEIGSSKPAADETIVLHIGDSITASIYLPFEQRVDALLRDMLAKEMPARKIRQINIGADGEFVKDLLTTDRYKKVVKENYELVDVAIIRYGAND